MKRRNPRSKFWKPLTPSAKLAAIVGDKPVTRTEMISNLWKYIRRNKLQSKSNPRMIKADAALKSSGDTSRQHQQVVAELVRLKQVVEGLQMARTNEPNIQRIENIPGRRIPFDYLVEIPILAGVQTEQPGSIPISQEGPFVATSRVIALRSTFEFQSIAPGTSTAVKFFGRSYGRFRPVHSAWDITDGQRVQQVTQAVGFPGTGAPHIISPSNEASFRSMEGDFMIKFVEGSTAYPRSNIPVPSSLWTKQINSPFDLGALDFFERGDVITFSVLPLHPNNPQYGNVSGFGAPNANYPFLPSQWDGVEGIQDPQNALALAVDPLTRLPNASLIIGFHGFRIVQPAGAGPY